MPRLVHLDRMPSRKTRPPKAELEPWEPGAAAVEVLRILDRYRYLTTELVGLVYDAEQGRGRARVRKLLTQLWRHGYVERHFRPADWGSNQYAYSLSVAGAQLVLDPKEWDLERRRVYNLAKPKRDYEHAIAVALLHVLWDLGSGSQEGTFRTVAAWQDKYGTKDKTTNAFAAVVDGAPVPVLPDLTLLIARQPTQSAPGGYYRPYFFEVERTHKNYDRLRRRLLAYAHLLSAAGESAVDDVFERELGVRPERGMAVFVTPSKHHAERLRTMAHSIVPADTELWFTSLEELLVLTPRTKADGTPYRDREGRPQRTEEPIPAEHFFTRDLLRALDGKRGKLVL